jgi:hypothetical protein
MQNLFYYFTFHQRCSSRSWKEKLPLSRWFIKEVFQISLLRLYWTGNIGTSPSDMNILITNLFESKLNFFFAIFDWFHTSKSFENFDFSVQKIREAIWILYLLIQVNYKHNQVLFWNQKRIFIHSIDRNTDFRDEKCSCSNRETACQTLAIIAIYDRNNHRIFLLV